MRKAKRTISGRTAVISGAASGMGRSLAQRLAAHGSPVAITDIDEPGLKETAASISGPVLTRVLDVRDADAQLAWGQEVREWTPTVIGSVFNNAGVALACSVRDADPDDDQWVWDINFHGVVNGTRAFLPILVEQNEGAIVNTSSIFGLAAVGMQSAYCAAKFAVRGYTEALRQEMLGSGVTAVTVHPGGVNTNIVRNGRYRVDHGEGGPTPEEMAAEFAAVTVTTADKAAEIIHRGVEAGKSRIIVGTDARLLDLLSRVTPSHYFDVMTKLQAPINKARRAASPS